MEGANAPSDPTQYYPAQLKETHGDEVDGWRNKIYWGDNLQVMSHLLKSYRGQITLIYIDPPFDSKADYKKRIELKGATVENDQSAFEEKQYTDIWTNDEYLQYMYERLILMRELLSEKGSLYLHCDWHKNHHLRLLLDEVFGEGNFVNEIIWKYKWASTVKKKFSQKHDTIFWYAKSAENWIFNLDEMREPYTEEQLKGYKKDEDGYYTLDSSGKKWYAHPKGQLPSDLFEIGIISRKSKERQKFPTQKPEALIERIIKASSNPGDLVFDCFMGSGTTQAVAMKLGRRFIGGDINLGAVEITTKRLLNLAEEIQENTEQEEIDLQEESTEDTQTFYTGIEVYNVNHYDVFRNPAQAKDLLLEALEIQPLDASTIYDGEKDGRMVKLCRLIGLRLARTSTN